MERRKQVEKNLDRNQQMRLFDRKENENNRKIRGTKMHMELTCFNFSNIRWKTFLTHLNVKLSCYPYFKILIIKYMDKIVII